MKRKEFIKIVESVMKSVQNNHPESYTCLLLDKEFYAQKRKDWMKNPQSRIVKDYNKVFGDIDCNVGYKIPVGFGEASLNFVKQVRLNALSMYLAQSLAFGTYKEL